VALQRGNAVSFLGTFPAKLVSRCSYLQLLLIFKPASLRPYNLSVLVETLNHAQSIVHNNDVSAVNESGWSYLVLLST